MATVTYARDCKHLGLGALPFALPECPQSHIEVQKWYKQQGENWHCLHIQAIS